MQKKHCTFKDTINPCDHVKHLHSGTNPQRSFCTLYIILKLPTMKNKNEERQKIFNNEIIL